MSDLGGKLRKADQRILAAFDRDLQEFRLSYENAMTAAERRQLTDWLRKLIKLEEECLPWPGVNLTIVVSHDLTDEKWESYYSGSASFNPRVLLRAVECWERGEGFVPPSGVATL